MKNLALALITFLSLNSAFAKDAVQNVDLKVTDNGFEPPEIKVKPGSHVILKVTRTTDQTCATQIKVNDKKTDLPLNKQVSIDAGTLKKGEIKFACGMDMISGHIIAE
jgi:plastocyanin domain-containing protein